MVAGFGEFVERNGLSCARVWGGVGMGSGQPEVKAPS